MSVVQTERLSDKLKEISASIPEAKVLERKLETMVKMEPVMEKTLAKIKQATSIPSIAELQAKTEAIKCATEGIEKATDGAKEATEEQKVAASEEQKVAAEAKETATEEATPEPVAKTAVKKSSKKAKAKASGLNEKVAFKKDLMEQASNALNNQIMNNIAVSSQTTDKKGNRICQKGEDEAFDNCV